MKRTTGNIMANKSLKKFLKRNSMILTALLLLVLVLAIFTDTFLTTNNILSVMRQISVDAVLAFGMAMVLIIGGIDLSGGSVLALRGCICGTPVQSGIPG